MVSGAPKPARSGPSDAALVVAARAGEQWAQEALFLRYTRMVNSLAYSVLGRDDDELDDMVQESFTKALANLHKLSHPAAFSTWLGSIVIRTARTKLRRRRLMNRLGLLRSEPIDVETIRFERAVPPDVAADLRRVYERLDDLPTDVRLVLVLRLVEGMQLADIASQMGMSLTTVKRRLRAARVLLGVDTGEVDDA